MERAHSHKKSITQLPGGWQRFADGFWESEPCHYNINRSKKFVSLAELFQTLVAAGEDFVRRSESSNELRDKVRFFLESTRVADPARYLPTTADESFAGYQRRINSMIGDTDFTLVVNQAQVYSLEIWNGMRAFLVGLCKIIGFPFRTDVAIYLSKSAKTAFGAHKDPYSNFLFQLEGQKKFQIWTDEAFERSSEFSGSFDDGEEIVDESISFDVRAGDLLYVPSGFYHSAEAGNELSIHVSLLLSTEKDQMFHFVERLATTVAKERYGASGLDPFVSADLSKTRLVDSLPVPIDAAFDAFANLDQELKMTVIEAWAKRASAYGCMVAPPPLTSCSLRDRDLIQTDTESLIICHAHGNEIYVASNGHGFVAPAHPGLIKMIEQLKTRRSWRVRDLLKEVCGRDVVDGFQSVLDKEAALRILNRLAQIRAIQVIR